MTRQTFFASIFALDVFFVVAPDAFVFFVVGAAFFAATGFAAGFEGFFSVVADFLATDLVAGAAFLTGAFVVAALVPVLGLGLAGLAF